MQTGIGNIFENTLIHTLSIILIHILFHLLLYRSTVLGTSYIQPYRGKKDDSSHSPESLFHPVPIKPTPDDINIGAELTGSLIKKTDLLRILNAFTQKTEIKELARQNGLDSIYIYIS